MISEIQGKAKHQLPATLRVILHTSVIHFLFAWNHHLISQPNQSQKKNKKKSKIISGIALLEHLSLARKAKQKFKEKTIFKVLENVCSSQKNEKLFILPIESRIL